jgi:hypothetical protein
MTTRSYNRSLLVNGLIPETQFISGWDESTLATQRAAIACDEQIPASSSGYVTQLISDSATIAIRMDAAQQLSRFVEWDN